MHVPTLPKTQQGYFRIGNVMNQTGGASEQTTMNAEIMNYPLINDGTSAIHGAWSVAIMPIDEPARII